MSSASEQNTGSRLQELASHVAPYVTVGELAWYWSVSRKQIYKQIEEGNLPAIRLGPRSLRIRTSDAIQFERRSSIALPEHDRRLQPVAHNNWSTPSDQKPRTRAKIISTKRF
jgi:excisionase family DNA binding protein